MQILEPDRFMIKFRDNPLCDLTYKHIDPFVVFALSAGQVVGG